MGKLYRLCPDCVSVILLHLIDNVMLSCRFGFERIHRHIKDYGSKLMKCYEHIQHQQQEYKTNYASMVHMVWRHISHYGSHRGSLFGTEIKLNPQISSSCNTDFWFVLTETHFAWQMSTLSLHRILMMMILIPVLSNWKRVMILISVISISKCVMTILIPVLSNWKRMMMMILISGLSNWKRALQNEPLWLP